jgi:hypothetical protein
VAATKGGQTHLWRDKGIDMQYSPEMDVGAKGLESFAFLGHWLEMVRAAMKQH